jgi:hypothetical protein
MTIETMQEPENEIVRMTVLCPKDLHEALWRARVGSPQGRKVTLSAFMVDAAREKLALIEQTTKAKPSRKRQRRVRR